ncbi:hypothetical protein [Microbulbifer marinus]|uniref:Ribosomal protein L7/L12 C-terminal domain-containing protein n=1 Tax=Microbulbifer marinus TaxID=658218 RepID=A0A1H3XD25_9GAMM|nr:hypothetical protein [Microbulbifer marinus]SDZ96861.1 hypothetical protein SAMN05216562_1459 [Microbulbifer marinus]
MSEPTYSLIFRGDLVPGFTAADVKANLARLFKAGPETVDKLFSGRPLAIKKGLSQAQAEQLQATLAKLGAQAALKADGEPVAPPAPAPQADEPASAPASAGPDWSLAPMEGNLVKEHERDRKETVQVSVDHLSLKPAQGNLIDESERSRTQAAAVEVPDWKLD